MPLNLVQVPYIDGIPIELLAVVSSLGSQHLDKAPRVQAYGSKSELDLSSDRLSSHFTINNHAFKVCILTSLLLSVSIVNLLNWLGWRCGHAPNHPGLSPLQLEFRYLFSS